METKQTADKILKCYEDDNEYHFHDVDREWIIKAMMEFATLSKMEIVYSDEDIYKEIEKLPFTKHLDDGQYNDGVLTGFELGAMWYREKIIKTYKGGDNE